MKYGADFWASVNFWFGFAMGAFATMFIIGIVGLVLSVLL